MDHIMASYGSRFFFKISGDRFFDPKSLSIDLLVMVPDFFDVTFDRFFSGPPKLSKMDPGSVLTGFWGGRRPT